MGDRKCAVQGCNALEFRDTGICNKHRGEGIEPLGADAEKIVLEVAIFSIKREVVPILTEF